MRPRGIDEVRGQGDVLRPGSPLRRLIEGSGGAAGPISAILWGPPGTGKTTLAHLVATAAGREFVELSAVTAGVKDVRAVMEHANRARDMYGRQTVLFLDEIHRFTKAQQDALLPGVENGWVILIAATTENPSFSVIAPLLSRSLLLTLETLSDEDLGLLVDRAVVDERGLGDRVVLEPEARAALIRLASGDARRALTALEASAVSAAAARATEQEGGDGAQGAEHHRGDEDEDETGNGLLDDDDEDDDEDDAAEEDDDAAERAAAPSEPAEKPVITADIVARAVDRALLRYDRQGDEHYDVISAFIKSVRGSDVDASMHYLARMIEAGEDPRFIARRIIVSASEDIGMADPQALVIAVAAADAVQFLGMPEGRIPLAEAVAYLATAPKSNASYLALDRAIADVRAGKIGRVPKHLRDAHYAGAKRLGHGKGYKYAHDWEHGVAPQQYLPDELVGTDYYEPKGNGYERDVSARLERLRRIIRGQ
ncbi:MAG: replication-associated recombination protein A [Ornithinibacter sp.]